MVLSLENYYDLLPNLRYMAFSCVPTVSYFLSVKFYSLFHKPYTYARPGRKYIESSSKNMISSSVANVFMSYPLFNYYSDIDSFSFYGLILGIFIVDTLEYFFHYFFHYNNFFYNTLHCVHHKPYPMAPEVSFSNHDVEVLITSPFILLLMVYLQMSFVEYILVTAMSFVATVSDHTITSKTKFHYIHHHVNKKTNLQQPFFTFWDHIFGTYNKTTSIKIPFIP